MFFEGKKTSVSKEDCEKIYQKHEDLFHTAQPLNAVSFEGPYYRVQVQMGMRKNIFETFVSDHMAYKSSDSCEPAGGWKIRQLVQQVNDLLKL